MSNVEFLTRGLESLWDDAAARGMTEPELLKYRSNLLGSDLRVTNYGGGNTSAKLTETDPLSGEEVEVLWVKGSGGDLGSIGLDGFSTLYLNKLHSLMHLYRGIEHEDEMVGYLPHCTFNLNPRAASIDTPLHSFIPHKHVDHMHPDSVIAIACTSRSQELTDEIFGGRLGWLPWQRPGFDLGVKLGELAKERPDLEGVILSGHGLFTWGDTSKSCYLKTIEIINTASEWLHRNNNSVAFGGVRYGRSLDKSVREQVAARLMPAIRGRITGDQMKVGHFNDSAEVLEFVNSQRLEELAALGTSCPDHFLRTKIRPLVIGFDPAAGRVDKEIDRILTEIDNALDAYRSDYAAYYERCKRANSPAMRDPNAVVYLIPGVGMITFAKDKATARIAGEFYVNAINVMRDADGVDTYVGLDEQEAFDIEYWLLEEAKLQRMPKPKSMAGHIALVTGGAGGIGSATAERLLREGACVMLADIEGDSLKAKIEQFSERFSADVVKSILCDVTKEASVADALAATSVAFGGLDVLVSNAGIASSAPLEETGLDVWQRNMDILSTGYFLMARESFKVMKAQDIGGSIVFVASKNALVASANASAYCTAKASEVQLARCIALEGAPHGIRCNTVNPDAVLRGSKIWTGTWRKERADAYNMSEDELEEHYRQRSMLKRNVFPEDIAEAIYFFASAISSKSTGNIINVDAGHAPSFTR
ncbi:bifunctional rhamnulose-1-phosphate aldolase/short-chain dehydrogenase [Aquisalinus flavus]|uniref:Short chain dehydrogenase n=1 Tax=Aquisalinus flavus TaxID=1526572 RepID=A0A8J2V6Z5_9PROT|nr:bifunctional rhamnulose-1-phosphate aldolase/short-chain dehydrogenase [Aquisalinus flavus]MBD0425965.1 bifunctional rhamnulose-1-phosphate aldolase/short-chain dehydrogenase [Aquisalinus flavus]UNE48442.1 bifunctional rhamnulose-1-phosphate aldolase/short-chain dehydrogenase [Aquisalinus flavus]GGD11816.1 short chain dehydrogenase [Aquisalinus flavus]